jgi:hypothetical protein
MILQKFSVLIFMCSYLTAAAPANECDSEITTDLTSTFIPETTTAMAFDMSSNEVEVDSEPFSGDDEDETAAVSDVDEKVGSIDVEMSSESPELGIENGSIQSIETSTIEEMETSSIQKMENFIEATTMAFVESDLATENEKSSIAKGTTMGELDDGVELNGHITPERSLDASDESADDSTTIPNYSANPTHIPQIASHQNPAPEDANKMENSDVSERAKVLEQISKVLQAQILRALFSLLSEASKRQKLNAHDSQTMASEVMERRLPPVSDSEYLVNTLQHDDKIIALHQQSVYIDEEDYERMISLQNSDYVRTQCCLEINPSETFPPRN